MTPTIYELATRGQETYRPILFWHPTRRLDEDEWSATCDALLGDAACRAVGLEAAMECPSWVGMDEILDQVVPMLEDMGFVRIETVACQWGDDVIIRDRRDDPSDPPAPAWVAVANAHNLRLELEDWENAGRKWGKPT